AAFGDPHGDIAQSRADLAFELAHTGFARVVANDRVQRVVGELGLFRRQPVRGELPFDEIPLRDLELLVLGVAREIDDLHAVAQWSRNVVDDIRGADEHDSRQIDWHAEIIVAESRVLLQVQHREERRGGVALDATAELVDLVEHHDAVAAPGAADALNDVAGERADIGAAVAADLGFVVRAAEADAGEFAPG